MRLDNLAIVLARTRNPLNMGAAARAMQNFGARQLRVVQPFEASFREAKSAVGAGEVLAHAQEFGSVAEAVADCRLVVGTTAARRRDLQQPVVSLAQSAALLHGTLAAGKVALLFGSEKHGLTRDDMEHCHWLLHVPTEEAQPSMNLGQAVAVCLWELAREAPAVKAADPRAAAGELERLTVLLLELLEAGGYTHPKTAASTRSEVRRMLRRVHVTEADSNLLMGMVRKLLWKVRASSSGPT